MTPDAKKKSNEKAAARMRLYRERKSQKKQPSEAQDTPVKQPAKRVSNPSPVKRLFRSDNATCLPGKKDCVKVAKEKKQVYVLNKYLHNLYHQYSAENPTKKISLSLFCRSRPEEVKLVKYAQKLSCLCFKHTNFALKLKSLENDDEELACRSYVAIVDSRSHSASTVFAILQQFMPMLKEGLPHIRQVHYFTDSPTSQYRNVSITTMLLKHESMFQLRADWLFFEAGHGKGP
ncbi:hypothetical protein LSAT2_023662, partial [Lamellibrachia satsuma]